MTRQLTISFKGITYAFMICYVLSGISGCSNQIPPEDEGHSPIKTPEQEWEAFEISDKLEIQLVASEPMVQDPVIMTFDGDGRLWVVEMRGYMPDIDGVGEDEPVGRVSILTDENGDGRRRCPDSRKGRRAL